MVRPVSGARRDLVVELAKCSFLLCRDPVLGDHQKVAVAVEITGSERERAGQGGADEGGSEDGLDTGNQLSQELVQLRKDRRRRRRSVCRRHSWIEPFTGVVASSLRHRAYGPGVAAEDPRAVAVLPS